MVPACSLTTTSYNTFGTVYVTGSTCSNCGHTHEPLQVIYYDDRSWADRAFEREMEQLRIGLRERVAKREAIQRERVEEARHRRERRPRPSPLSTPAWPAVMRSFSR